MSIGRNSKTLVDLFWDKMEYHQDLEEIDEKTGEIIPISNCYEHSISGMVEGCMDFDFTIIKHDKPFIEELDEIIPPFPNEIALSFIEAIREFS